MANITVIGDGGWGTALAIVLNNNGHEVTLWGAFKEYTDEMVRSRNNRKFLPGIALPEGLALRADIEDSCKNRDGFVIAVPSKFYAAVLEKFAPHIPKEAFVVSVAKGFNREDKGLMTETAERILPQKHIAALSGPSHAEEVAKGVPAAVTIACEDTSCAEFWQQTFSSDTFRIYTSNDVIGVELGGALKNVLAVAAGIADGIGYGDNTKAALITRGLAEMKRLGKAYGADPETFSGLSGIGDLIVTCASKLSRNRAVGERIGKGENIDDILGSMDMVAEGVWTAQSAYEIAQEKNIDLPIAEETYNVIYQGKDPKQAVNDLLARRPKPETH